MTDAATIQVRLNEAELARHKIAIGQAHASVQVDGVSSVTYSKANLGELDAYIVSLRAQLAQAQGGRSGRRGPLHLAF